MPSPFPGMAPYLEAIWRDVHHRLVTYISDALKPGLPPNLCACVEERVVLETETVLEKRGLVPDVRDVEYPPQLGAAPTRQSAGVAIAEPVVIVDRPDPVTEGYIEIIDATSGNKVVTVIEVFSPTNKKFGLGMLNYVKKQMEILESDSNLVEIDLLLGGRQILSVKAEHIQPGYRSPYNVCVRRASNPIQAELYPIDVRRPLPTIGVPLRQGDPDAALNLQSVLEQSYRLGRFDLRVNYAIDPVPPLPPPYAEWADALLREKGLRPPKPPGKGKRKPRN